MVEDRCNQWLAACHLGIQSVAVAGSLSAEGIDSQSVAQSIVTRVGSRMDFAPVAVGSSESKTWAVP